MKKILASLSIFLLSFFLLTLSIPSASLSAAEVPNPKLESPENWTIVVVPDPQQYTNPRNHERYWQMFGWIADNLETLNVKTVLCVGDIVNSNVKPAQWKASSKAFEFLDGKIPYVLCTGNHDYGSGGANTRESNLDKYFPVDRNPKWDGVLVEVGENLAGKKTLENTAYQFQGPQGQKLLVISLQFAPNEKLLDWAHSLATGKYADHFVILLTHNYMHSHKRGDIRTNNHPYPVMKVDGLNGEEIWQKFVKKTPNVRMVISGHISASDDFTGCVGWRIDQNDAGKPVYQMLFDTQALGGGFGGNGGDGWLRLIEFTPDMKHAKAYTYSPYFAQDPETAEKAFETSPINAFEFEIE
ncbi:MAG: serine/threonine protein phosphatase [Planctomycetaceae bacterium]|nr:serine/threonine protein phosphatase [Planctomycetaceae bacterium]